MDDKEVKRLIPWKSREVHTVLHSFTFAALVVVNYGCVAILTVLWEKQEPYVLLACSVLWPS